MVSQSFKLGAWQVEPGHNRIQQPGLAVSLEPRVMDLLTVLAKYPGRVLSKDQLVE